MQIHHDLRNFLPPLADEELSNLEAEILRVGCREPLTTWIDPKGAEWLLDGHNRYDICERHGIPYEAVAIGLPEGLQPEEWIILNQFGRRNLNNAWRAKLANKMKAILEKEARERQKESSVQNSAPGSMERKSAVRAGQQFDVSHDTMRKAKVIEEEGPPGLVARWLDGEISTNAAFNQLTKKSETAQVEAKEIKKKEDDKLRALLLKRIDSRVESNEGKVNLPGVNSDMRQELLIETKTLRMVKRWIGKYK